MFLIEYRKDMFVNAKHIDWIEIKNGVINLTIISDQDNVYSVDVGLNEIFLNHLNCFNDNISKLEIKEAS